MKAVVTAVDAAAGTLTVRDAGGAEIALAAGAGTRIKAAGKPATLADLKAGDRVAATYQGAGAALTALFIKVLPGPSGH